MPVLVVLVVIVVVGGAFVLLSGGDDEAGDGGGDGSLAASGDTSDPEAAANAYVEALAAGDCAAYVALWSQDYLGGDTVEEAVEDCEADGGPTPITGTVTDIEVISEDGDTASVGIEIEPADGSGDTTYRELSFVREDDGWRWTGETFVGPPPAGSGDGSDDDADGGFGDDGPDDGPDDGGFGSDGGSRLGEDDGSGSQEEFREQLDQELEEMCRSLPPGYGGYEGDPEAQYEACINGELFG